MTTFSDHYWIVAGSSTQVFSSKVGDYVAVNNATYIAWLAKGNLPSKIDTENNLGDVLAFYSDTITRPVPVAILNGFTDRLADATLKVIKAMLATNNLNMENRIRALERAVLSATAPDLTNAQLKQLIKPMM